MKGVKRFAKTVDVALGTVVTPCKRRTSPAGTARAGVCANHAGTANNSLPPAKSCPHRRCDGHSRRLTHASAKSQRNLLFCAVPRSDWAGSCLLLKALPHGPYPLAAKRGNAMVGTEAVASARSREEAGPTPRTPIVASVELDHCSRCIRVVEPMHALGAACLWAAPVCWTYDVTACSRVPESVRLDLAATPSNAAPKLRRSPESGWPSPGVAAAKCQSTNRATKSAVGRSALRRRL